MSRYTGPSRKQARRVGFSILETGTDLARRPYGPGQHGQDRKGKLSNYGEQLKEKQKVRFMYGVNERQFHKTFIEAGKMKGMHGENFLKLLESRLDNVVYRLGLAATRRGARQVVNHGHITVNGKRVNIPSYSVKVGDVIAVKENKQKKALFAEIRESRVIVPKWLEFDADKLTGKVNALPQRDYIDLNIEEHLIVELYSK